ncbi:MAG: hypothetical protein A3A26_02795 [Candidatus Zambryskibacteria bacterium RIFCSPLOWO2_01_FULL_47_14]|uniref:Uncharacterized protein n=2 Tax=Candidatus Zambryskiibacteriota TaxID=1817925 RepID=A0A1G2U887_9BACT|nr:MAG: hypothetical protein A3A26_02795 [Candidatus Zambryskibacteria bacterium RIFCSPLOWO2_01_FULL_47_14]
MEEDFTDIWKGHYPELKGSMGLMGEMGGRGGGKRGEIGDIEKLKFYPLDTSLPQVVQLKLRAKEINLLIENLQKSLVIKMSSSMTLPAGERIRLREQVEDDFDHWLANERKKFDKRD